MRIIFILCLLAVGFAFAQSNIDITINTDTKKVTVETVDPYFPHFTVGHHRPDSTLTFICQQNLCQANLPAFTRLKTAGYFFDGEMGIYHLSAGAVPTNVSDSLILNFYVPGKSVLLKGKIFAQQGKISFDNYFTAREFPLFWFVPDKYQVELVAINELDTIQVVYAWADSIGLALLDTVSKITSQTIKKIGKVAPLFWHKHLSKWEGATYTLIVFLNAPPVGLEHFNSPFVGINPNYLNLTADVITHELLHSLIGKATMPLAYLQADGRFRPTDALGYYEGLTVYLTQRFLPWQTFVRNLGWIVSNAKLLMENDLRIVSLTDKKYESYYFKGYLFWFVLNSKFNFIDDWIKWLFEKKLINRSIPVPTNMDSVLTWLSEYDRKIGDCAVEIISGKYMQIADLLLAENGWQPIYFKDDPSYSWAYIGPYPLYQGGMVLPIDTLNIPAGTTPKYLLTASGGKLELKLPRQGKLTLGMKIITASPDSVVTIIMSNGDTVQTSKNPKFSDGSDYFISGKINLNKNNRHFWRKHCLDF